MEKSLFCLDCNGVFGKDLTYQARNRCSRCYSRLKRGELETEKKIITSCITCNLDWGSINEKGKLITKGPRGHCRSCFYKLNKAISICDGCNEKMLKPTITRLCPLCRIKKNIESGNRKYKSNSIPIRIENEEFELIRRLLVRYKLGMNNMADDFRVVDVYLTIKDAPEYLDTLNERQQVVEMLRHLKATFDYNLDERKKDLLKPKKYSKDWYNKSPKSYKNKCKSKWHT